MKKTPILISEGNRSFFALFLSALSFTLGVFFLILFFGGINLLNQDLNYNKYQVDALYMAILLFPIGIVYGRSKNVFLDVSSNSVKEQWLLGPFKYGKWEHLEEIDYVYVFKSKKVSGPDIFEVNLWFTTGRRRSLFQHGDEDPAIELGKLIAKKLGKNFKDSSDPHNPKWFNYVDL